MSEANVLKEITSLCREYETRFQRYGGRGKLHVNEVSLIIKSIKMTAQGGIAALEREEEKN